MMIMLIMNMIMKRSKEGSEGKRRRGKKQTIARKFYEWKLKQIE